MKIIKKTIKGLRDSEILFSDHLIEFFNRLLFVTVFLGLLTTIDVLRVWGVYFPATYFKPESLKPTIYEISITFEL